MNLNRLDIPPLGRTLAVVGLAVVLCWAFWRYYMYSPWTRDGRVRVEVVNVASQIQGKVIKLEVTDNQLVHRDDVLFEIEPDDYQLALAQAESIVQSRQADLTVRNEELTRRKKLGLEAVSIEAVQLAESAQLEAVAAYQAAVSARDLAKLNLERTKIHAPANGYITNLHLRVGDYANIGETKLSMVDSDSFWIVGYFEETKLPRVHIGDYAAVKLMGVSPEIKGHVESFARGIADANGAASVQGLADVNPIFTWVRLAQRIPVRIHIDEVPEDVKIAAGQTCTIVLSAPRK